MRDLRNAARDVEAGERVEREVRRDHVGPMPANLATQRAARGHEAQRQRLRRGAEAVDGTARILRHARRAGDDAAHFHARAGQRPDERVIHAVEPAGTFGKPVHADL
jgi:hypothetical protein